MLNQEFFEEIRKKDEHDIINHFGHQVGKLLIKHANLEDKFNNVCVEDGVKMTPITDENITEEQRQCMVDVRDTTSKLIRAFSNRENQLKIKAYEQKSVDFNGYIESFAQLQKLYTYKLNTPLEDVNSIKDNLKLLKEKTETLTDLRNSKKDQYDKYVEECNKSKELRGITMKILSQQVGTEKVDCETQIAEAKEKGMKDEEDLKLAHEQTMEQLEKRRKNLEGDVNRVKMDNEKEEAELRKKFKAISSAYQNNM